MALGISRTAIGTSSQVPAVDVAVTGDTSGRVQIDRLIGAVATPLRGTPIDTVAGAVTVRDYEVPQNTAVTYRVYPVGSVGLAVATSAITITDRGAWLVHPALGGTLSVQAVPMRWPAWQRDARQSRVDPLGVSTPVVVSDVRGSRQGTFTVYVAGAAAAAALSALLDSTRVVLLSSVRYPAPYVWVSIGEETWTPLEATIGASTTDLWQVDLPLTEVARPAITSSGVVTWLDVAARYTTWNDLAAAYTTWDALLADTAAWTS